MHRLSPLAALTAACLLVAACSSKNNATRTTVTTPAPQARFGATATPVTALVSPTPVTITATPAIGTAVPGVESPSPSPAPTEAPSPTATSAAQTSATTPPTQTTAAAAPSPTQTAAPTPVPTTAPAATAAPTQAAAAASTATGNGIDPNTLLDEIKLTAGDLPAGFSLGALTSTEQNAQAVTGFDDPQSALQLMNSTGRQIGLVQQVNTPDSASGAGISIEIWQDDAGARAWLNSYPAPESDLAPQRLTPPQQVGDQTILYRFNQNGTIIYSITWRRGRVVLGVGEPFGSDAGALDKLMQIVNILDAKAVAALNGG